MLRLFSIVVFIFLLHITLIIIRIKIIATLFTIPLDLHIDPSKEDWREEEKDEGGGGERKS